MRGLNTMEEEIIAGKKRCYSFEGYLSSTAGFY